MWDGYNLTHPFLDDRSTVFHGCSAPITFEQEATLRIPASNAPVPQPLPPVIQPPVQVRDTTIAVSVSSAVSLEQPLTVEAAPVDEVTEDTAMSVTPDQPGEHVAELTPNAVLVDPIGELTVDTDAETVVPSPTKRASMSNVLPRSRNKSAVQ